MRNTGQLPLSVEKLRETFPASPTSAPYCPFHERPQNHHGTGSTTRVARASTGTRGRLRCLRCLRCLRRTVPAAEGRAGERRPVGSGGLQHRITAASARNGPTVTALRAAWRYIQQRISEHPDTDITYEAECLWCDWQAMPSTDSAAVDVNCMSHTGRSGHRSFRRIRTSFAIVVRAQ